MKRKLTRKSVVNVVMFTLTGLCTLVSVGVLIFILGYLFFHGASSLSWSFFTRLPAPVGESGGGMANAILGSAKVLLLAILLGMPLGFLGGVYLSEYSGRRAAFVVRYATDLLNGVPSIVVGILVYNLIVRRMGHFSAIAGGIALGILAIPIAVRATEEYLQSVPKALREGSLALGATKWRTIANIVIPAASRGIASGMLLALARIAGETAPLLFTSLNNQFWGLGFNRPTPTLPVMIFLYATGPYEEWHRQAWAAGFILLFFVLAINFVARFVLAKRASA